MVWVYHHLKHDTLHVVFVCSAKYDGTSLNELLRTGGLYRFKKIMVAIMYDVEIMFH
jgi:hypothetical protein